LSDRRAAAILAHPDDAEFLCAGTLALLAARGWQVTIVTASPGDCGSATTPPDLIAEIRRGEAARAAAHLNAEYRCLEERDLAIDYDTATRRRFTEAIRQIRPGLVFTHPLADYMADHEIVGRLVRDACFTGPMPNFRASGSAPPLDGIPYLYYCSPFQPDQADPADKPTVVVDIGDGLEIRRQMLTEHASQRDWLRRQHGVDEYMRLQDELSQSAGRRSGLLHAEAFRQHRGHPYPQDDLLAAVLGPLAHPVPGGSGRLHE
jgi:N-acetylglucosamine malate deacetylase 1